MAAMAQVEGLTASIQVGRIYEGRVTSIKDFGAFVELKDGSDGLVHDVFKTDLGYIGAGQISGQ